MPSLYQKWLAADLTDDEREALEDDEDTRYNDDADAFRKGE